MHPPQEEKMKLKLSWIPRLCFVWVVLSCNSTDNNSPDIYERGKALNISLENLFNRELLLNLPVLNRFDSSKKSLDSALKISDSYQYIIWNQIGLGAREETEIYVKASKVVARSYEFSHLHSQDKISYFEIDRLGYNELGFRPILLDSVYLLCEEYLQADTAKYFPFLNLDENFIISGCGYRIKYCADDCSPGIRILDINWVKY
jgi:hypothetical protein